MEDQDLQNPQNLDPRPAPLPVAVQAAPPRKAWDTDKWQRLASVNPAQRSIGREQWDALNAVQRLMNIDATAEGTALPPVLSAGTRIESPTDFVVGYQEEMEGGCRFILQWATPASMLTFQPRFRVYAYYGQGNIVWATGQSATTPDDFGYPVIVANVDTSPADFFITNALRRPIRFELEMRLGSGWVMVAAQRPCCTAMLNPIESYYREISAAYAMTTRDRVIRGDASGGAFNLTLPDPTLKPYGWHCDLRNYGGANNITAVPFASETIDGAASYALTPGSQTFIYTDGTNWRR